MGFFVPKQKKQETKKKTNNKRFDLVLIANAKRMDMSMGELNQFRLRDFVALTDIYFGSDEDDEPSMATQKEIDKLLS